MKQKLSEIVSYLNTRFNQQSEDYSIFFGAKPQIFRYDKETAISLWACGAIVCIGSILYFISEDDGNWFINEKDKYNIGLQSSFSIGWADSFVKALENLSKYVEENGVPVRYQLGTDKDGNQIYGDICNYRLE